MAEYFVRDTSVAWSTAPEGTFNTASVTDTDYTTMPIEPPPLLMPQPEQSPLLGGGIEFAENFCNGYWTPLSFPFNPVFDFAMALRFGLQAHGGTSTDTNPATGAYKYSKVLQAAAGGVNLQGRSLAVKNGNLSFLFAGNAVDTFEIAQIGGALPTVSVGIVGTSKYTNPIGFTLPAVSLACPQTVTTAIYITDSYGAARDLYAAEVYSWRMFLRNGADASSNKVRKANDSSQGPTSGTAKYPAKIIRSFPRGLGLEATVNFEDLTGSSKAYFEQMAKRNAITSVSLRIRGDLITGSTYNQLDWIIAEGVWTATPLIDQDQILAYNLSFSPTHNTTPSTFAVTNTTASGYA